ncbi:MAG: CPBP family intramembrane metalloprotease [Campylobacterales bacterium]|nr:CPBP family intramembrane metalloprotease [Campylobacterales bacterium]
MALGWLYAEMVLLFVAPSLSVYFGVMPPWMIIPGLWVLTLYAYWILRRHQMPVFEPLRHYCRHLLGRTALLGVLGLAMLVFIGYSKLFVLVLERPLVWVAILALYPLLSALPQEILFRRFFFYRYSALMGSGALFWLSAALFALAHLPFGNEVALAGSFAGGILFAHSYRQSGTILSSWIEHSLYGIMIFTFGLGHYFYHGRIGA